MNVALYVVTVAQCVYAASMGVGRVSVEGRRTCRLYCRVGIGFHLQIHENGHVNGSHEPNHLSKSHTSALFNAPCLEWLQFLGLGLET